MSGYHKKIIRDDEDFKEDVRNINNGLKGQKITKGEFSKEITVLARFFQGNVRNLRCLDSSHVRVTYGTNQRQ